MANARAHKSFHISATAAGAVAGGIVGGYGFGPGFKNIRVKRGKGHAGLHATWNSKHARNSIITGAGVFTGVKGVQMVQKRKRRNQLKTSTDKQLLHG